MMSLLTPAFGTSLLKGIAKVGSSLFAWRNRKTLESTLNEVPEGVGAGNALRTNQRKELKRLKKLVASGEVLEIMPGTFVRRSMLNPSYFHGKRF